VERFFRGISGTRVGDPPASEADDFIRRPACGGSIAATLRAWSITKVATRHRISSSDRWQDHGTALPWVL
jgi:hypothetical protein